MKKILKVLIWIWQLPQNVIGLLFVYMFWKGIVYHPDIPDKYFYIWNSKFGSLTLGEYVLLGKMHLEDDTYKHEYGHTIQSRILGPFWLLVVGFPSLIWGAIHPYIKRKYSVKYSWFYTERWANSLAGSTID